MKGTRFLAILAPEIESGAISLVRLISGVLVRSLSELAHDPPIDESTYNRLSPGRNLKNKPISKPLSATCHSCPTRPTRNWG
jgi:hypothetical protein